MLAKLVGISTDTLRLYERKGLLRSPMRTANGYRCYSPDCVARLRLIRAALSIGFTLDELAKILKIRDAGGAPCHKVRDLAISKLAGLEQHIRQLALLRDQLRNLLKSWDRLLEETPQHQRAGLLEMLAAAPAKPRILPAHLYAAVTRETRR
jgi:DNA-binding transcriptional MerR regulator